MLKHKLVDFIIQFMEEVDKEISEMKLFVCHALSAPIVQDQADIWATVKRAGALCGRIILDTGRTQSQIHNPLPLPSDPLLVRLRGEPLRESSKRCMHSASWKVCSTTPRCLSELQSIATGVLVKASERI